MQGQTGNFRRDRTKRINQMEILEVKTMKAEMKNSFSGFTSQIDSVNLKIGQ